MEEIVFIVRFPFLQLILLASLSSEGTSLVLVGDFGLECSYMVVLRYSCVEYTDTASVASPFQLSLSLAPMPTHCGMSIGSTKHIVRHQVNGHNTPTSMSEPSHTHGVMGIRYAYFHRLLSITRVCYCGMLTFMEDPILERQSKLCQEGLRF